MTITKPDIKSYAETFHQARAMLEQHDFLKGTTIISLNADFSLHYGDMLLGWRINNFGAANEESLVVRCQDLLEGIQELIRRRAKDTRMAPLALPRVKEVEPKVEPTSDDVGF